MWYIWSGCLISNLRGMFLAGSFAELVVAASVLFAVFWIALIPVFGLPNLDTGGESFRYATDRLRCRLPLGRAVGADISLSGGGVYSALALRVIVLTHACMR